MKVPDSMKMRAVVIALHEGILGMAREEYASKDNLSHPPMLVSWELKDNAEAQAAAAEAANDPDMVAVEIRPKTIEVVSMASVAEKDALAERLARESLVGAACLISEAWMSQFDTKDPSKLDAEDREALAGRILPRDYSKRREALIITIRCADGTDAFAHHIITRSESGRATLEDGELTWGGSRMAGRFAPRPPIPEADAELLRRILSASDGKPN